MFFGQRRGEKMWNFLYDAFRGLVGTFLLAMFLNWLGRKRKIVWVLRNQRMTLGFIWILEVIGALSLFMLVPTASVVAITVIWIVGVAGTIFAFDRFSFEFVEKATFGQWVFCVVYIPLLGAAMFFASVFVHIYG